MPWIKLKTDHVSAGNRVCAAGDVVEVDKVRRKRLVEQGHAEDHPGPAPGTGPETATHKAAARAERAVARR